MKTSNLICYINASWIQLKIFHPIAIHVHKEIDEYFILFYTFFKLAEPVLTKQNCQFDNKKDYYCSPKWTSKEVPQVKEIN